MSLDKKFQVLPCQANLEVGLAHTTQLSLRQRPHPQCFSSRRPETVAEALFPRDQGSSGLTFKKWVEGAEPAALRACFKATASQRRCNPAPRQPATPALHLRRRDRAIPGPPRSGNLPPAARVPTAAARGATAEPERQLQPARPAATWKVSSARLPWGL